MKKLVQIFSKDFHRILSDHRSAPIKRAFLLFSGMIFTMIFSSCHSMRQVEIVERVKTDTLYRSNIQYDSIYIFSDHYIDRSKDTIYIRDLQLQYKYKLLRDTIYKSRVDSIPIIKTVEVTKEITYIPWYVKTLAWLGAIVILLLIFLFLRKLNIWHLS